MSKQYQQKKNFFANFALCTTCRNAPYLVKKKLLPTCGQRLTVACLPSRYISQSSHQLTYNSSNAIVFRHNLDVNKSLLNLHKLADGNDDPQLTDFIEGKYLEEQVQAIKKLADMVTQLNRVGEGNDRLLVISYYCGHVTQGIFHIY
jgi:hypothetical protein